MLLLMAQLSAAVWSMACLALLKAKVAKEGGVGEAKTVADDLEIMSLSLSTM